MTDLLNSAIEQYNPRYVIAMFSGGHDSLTAAHIASQHPRFSFALHINTGIGIEQTRDFVRQTCKDWGVGLREYKATENTRADGSPDPQDYEQIVMAEGFPGAFAHRYMYSKLKERPLRMAIRDLGLGRGERVLLVTGVRSQESVRRMAHVSVIQEDGARVWVAPIHEYNKRDVNEYIARHGLRRNPVVDMLHMSGECLCGAYAHPGEKKEIAFWFPEMGKYIDDLERRVNDAGFPWGWEEGPPDWWIKYQRGQEILPGLEEMLCQSCELKRR